MAILYLFSDWFFLWFISLCCVYSTNFFNFYYFIISFYYSISFVFIVSLLTRFFFRTVLTCGLSRGTRWHQFCSGLQDSTKYCFWPKQCCGLYSLDSMSDSNFLSHFSTHFETIISVQNIIGITDLHIPLLFQPFGKIQVYLFTFIPFFFSPCPLEY